MENISVAWSSNVVVVNTGLFVAGDTNPLWGCVTKGNRGHIPSVAAHCGKGAAKSSQVGM